MVMGFDPSDLLDGYFTERLDEEPLDLGCSVELGLLPERVMKAVVRYERKLGRKLTTNEGWVLIHAYGEEDPQDTGPRFTICADCGGWVDNGKLWQRGLVHREKCDWCDVPF
jgi:hypothetical protein